MFIFCCRSRHVNHTPLLADQKQINKYSGSPISSTTSSPIQIHQAVSPVFKEKNSSSQKSNRKLAAKIIIETTSTSSSEIKNLAKNFNQSNISPPSYQASFAVSPQLPSTKISSRLTKPKLAAKIILGGNFPMPITVPSQTNHYNSSQTPSPSLKANLVSTPNLARFFFQSPHPFSESLDTTAPLEDDFPDLDTIFVLDLDQPYCQMDRSSTMENTPQERSMNATLLQNKSHDQVYEITEDLEMNLQNSIENNPNTIFFALKNSKEGFVE